MNRVSRAAKDGGLFAGPAMKECVGPAALALALCAPLPAAAQAVPAPPPTREELDVSRNLRDQPQAPARVTVTGDVERGPCPLANPAFADTRVNFARVDFANLEAVAPSVLDDSWRDLAGREMPVAALCEVRDRAATALRAMGYLAAVQIPPQRIETGGTVRMDVLVARLAEVQVRGDIGANSGTIAAHMERLKRDPWFNTRTAERQLMLLGDIPGQQVRLTLKPAKGRPGEVIGDLLVSHRRVEAAAGIQNLGAKATGREGVFAMAAFNGLTGLADRTTLTAFSTLELDEQTVLQADHEFALNADGLRLAGGVLWGQSDPTVGIDFKSRTLAADIAVKYPLVRRRDLALLGEAGLELVNQSVRFAGAPFTRDRLRVAYLRARMDAIDPASLAGRGGYSAGEPRWRVGLAAEARQGLAGLGASKDCNPISRCTGTGPGTGAVPISNLLADPAATVLRAEAQAEYRPVPEVTLAVAPRAQYSPDTLLSYEQFSVGNYTVGRGIDPGTWQGDSGLGSSFEMRYGRLAGRQTGKVAVQPFVFVDAAWTWRRDGGVTRDPQPAVSGGGGVRARWDDRFDTNLLLAAPLRRADLAPGRRDLRLLFTIRARLLPWDPK